MNVLLIAGSPTRSSRSAALLAVAGARLEALGFPVRMLAVRDLPADAVLQADFARPGIVDAVRLVHEADAVVVATPVYKAAYSGALKAFLDLLPQHGFAGKAVLPLATGGSAGHMLALDYALRPVLQSLAAASVLPGIYAVESQVALLPEGGVQLAAEIGERLDAGVHALATQLRHGAADTTFGPVAFSQVRCSV